jgi:hypothetical protein
MNRRSFFARLLGIAAIPVVGKVAAVPWVGVDIGSADVTATAIASRLGPTIGETLFTGEWGIWNGIRFYEGLQWTSERMRLLQQEQDAVNCSYWLALNRIRTVNKPLAFERRTPITGKF